MHLKWEYTLTGETLDRVAYDKDGLQVSRRLSSGDVVLLESNYNISRSEQATLIIYDISEADRAVFECSVETLSETWRNKIQVSVVCKYIQCTRILSFYSPL